ncbi:hypothetical protein Tco_1533252 [Tanacetum coccineum]
MPPRVRTQSAGRPAAESLGGGTGKRVGRGGRGKRLKEGNDERIDDLNGQGNDQGIGANWGVEGVNGNVERASRGAPDFSMIIAQQLQNLLPAMLAHVSNRGNIENQNGNVVNENVQDNVRNVLVNGNRVGCLYKEFLACNPKEYDGKGGAIVLTRWIEKIHEVQKLESELWNHAMVGAGHAAHTDRFHELTRLVTHLVTLESRMIERPVIGGLDVASNQGTRSIAWRIIKIERPGMVDEERPRISSLRAYLSPFSWDKESLSVMLNALLHSSSQPQNVAFVLRKSTSFDYSFFANQSSGPQLDHEDIEQVDEFDLEEIDLKWQVAMISMRLKKFYKNTGRKLQFDAKEPVGFDKTKVEYFNFHNTWHFAKECISKVNLESRRRDAGNTGYKAKNNGRRPRKQEEPKALVTLDRDGVDWTGHAEDEQENFALMAYSNSGSNTKDDPQKDLKNKGIVDSGCSRHMTRNKAYLVEYQDNNGGPVAFGGIKFQITGKGAKDQEDQAFLEELEGLKDKKMRLIDAVELLEGVCSMIEAIGIFLAFASYMGFIVYQMDVQIERLLGSAYGLHQAPRAWYATLSTFLLKNGYKRGTIDKTLFIKKDRNDVMLVQKEDGIFISQDKYVAEILKKFDFANVKSAITPIETHKPLNKDEEVADVDVHLYRSMIGSLMYLTASRPDIMYAVCACSRFQVTPKTSHLHAVKRIFRYLKGKPKLGLWYIRKRTFTHITIDAYSDSDYARANLDRKSTTGEAEYVAARTRWFLMFFGIRIESYIWDKDFTPKQIILRLGPTLDAFDDLDADLAHGMDYMETEEAMKEGRQSNETEELNLDADTEVHTTNALVSTAGVTISTVDPEVSVVEPRTPPTTTSIFDDEDITMAQTLIKMKEEKAKEKGVAFKYVEDSSRPVRSITTLKPLLSIDPC